jgi:hypothetical protein
MTTKVALRKYLKVSYMEEENSASQKNARKSKPF